MEDVDVSQLLPPIGDPIPNVKMRFSTIRFHRAMKDLNDGHISSLKKYNLSHFLDIPYHLMVPLPLIEWIANHTMTKARSVFYHKGRHCQITKEMVYQVLHLPCGSTKFSLSDFALKYSDEYSSLRSSYECDDGNHITLKTVISMMMNAESEEAFLRNFVLILFTCVICPSTHNFVNPIYLYLLIDMSQFMNIDLCSLVLEKMCFELENWSRRKTKQLRFGGTRTPLFLGGCMPLYAIVYMDMVDLALCDRSSGIDYGTPRICHVKTSDFNFLVDADRNWGSNKDVAFGNLPLRDVLHTPYRLQALRFVELSSGRPSRPGVNNSGINQLPSSAHIPPQVNLSVDEVVHEVVVKHQDLWSVDFKKCADSFLSSVECASTNRFMLLVSDLSLVLSKHFKSNNGAHVNVSTVPSSVLPVPFNLGLDDVQVDPNVGLNSSPATNTSDGLNPANVVSVGNINIPLNTPSNGPPLEKVNDFVGSIRNIPLDGSSAGIHVQGCNDDEGANVSVPVDILHSEQHEISSNRGVLIGNSISDVPTLVQDSIVLDQVHNVNGGDVESSGDAHLYSDNVDCGEGVNIAMSYASASINLDHSNVVTADVISPGLSTIDKLARKKRKAKELYSDEVLCKLPIDDVTEKFYDPYLKVKKSKFSDQVFVQLSDQFPITYSQF